MTNPLNSAMITEKARRWFDLALKVKRQDDLDSMFGKFAQMDPTDVKRDKFLKRNDEHKNDKKGKGLIKDDQIKHEKKHEHD
jgi:hypothetical protein